MSFRWCKSPPGVLCVANNRKRVSLVSIERHMVESPRVRVLLLGLLGLIGLSEKGARAT
jgi:hypothetical protein